MTYSNVQKTNRNKQRYKKLITIGQASSLAKKLKAKHKKIVFTLGTFDLLNPGHCRYLAEAKALGDVLVVGISSDSSIRQLKGSDFPLVGEDIRAELVSFLKTVDYVIYVDEMSPHALLLLLQPDIFLTSESNWSTGIRNALDKDIVKVYGGKIIKQSVQAPYYSTSSLIDHVANIRVLQIFSRYYSEMGKNLNLDVTTLFSPADYGAQIPKVKNAFNSNTIIIRNSDYSQVTALRKKGKKVVFVSGSYDLLHVGHARFIEQAGLLGDILVVGIPSDTSLRKLKGVGRPVISEASRAYILGHLDPVDFVSIFDDTTVLTALKALQPDVFFTVNESWNKDYKNSAEYKYVIGYGGEVALAERQAPFLSASLIIDKIARKKVIEIFRECMDEQKYDKIVFEKSKITNGVNNGKN